MAQTLVSLMVHVIFSTKNREQLLAPEIEPELFAYIGGILKNNESRLLDAGGTSDHVHLLISQSKTIALSALMKDVKKDSSSWIKTKGREFRNFHWQDGYGAFSNRPIGPSQFEEIPSRPEGTSSQAIVSRGTDSISERVWDRIRRAIFVELIRPFQGRGFIFGAWSVGFTHGY